MDEKIYVGKGKTIGQYGHVSFSIDIDAVTPYIFEYNGKRYVKLILTQMRQPDQYGKTHTVSIDTWKPEENQKNQNPVEKIPEAHGNSIESKSSEDNDDVIPF